MKQYESNELITFDRFQIDPVRRAFYRENELVPLTSKAFDVLLALIERHGEIVSKEELLNAVWPDQFIEENNLTVHIVALRKALAETKGEHRYIITVPGKGYRFAAELDNQSNGDLVIESREVSRIVIEDTESAEHSQASKSANEAANLSVHKTETATVSRRRLAVGFAASILVLGALGGYAFREQLAANFVSTPSFSKHGVKQLTANGKVGLAALSPDGKLFAYTIDDLGKKSLWLGYVEGGNHIELSPPTEVIYSSLAFSPDSKDLFFSLCNEKNPKCALYRMPAFGGIQTKLLDEVESAALSPDGRSIAMGRRDEDQGKDFLVIASLDGAQRRNVTSFPRERTFRFDTISWSPDGKLLALSANTDTEIAANEIVVVDVASGELDRVRHSALREITKTSWLRDGSGLIVTAIEPGSNSSVPQYVVYRISYPSGELHAITTDLSNYGASWHNDAGVSISLSSASDVLLAVEHRQLSNVWVAPADDLGAARQITFGSFGKYDGLWGMDWTPDGRLIYTTSDSQSQFLSQMKSDGSEQKQITAPEGYDSVLTVTQDGRYVVFHSGRSSTIDVWRTDIDGTNPKQLTFGGKGFHPAPSPDGKWVYYRSTLSGKGQLCRVPIDGGEPETLTDKETAWISFSPDGKYFAALYVTDRSRLAIFSAETNQILKQFDLPKTGTLYMGTRWTPDSKAVTYRDNAYGYWIQPIDEGEPQRLAGLPNEKLYNFSWSKDGKWLAFVRGQEIRDVVLLTSNH